MTYALMTKRNFTRKPGTKTVYLLDKEETAPIDKETYQNIVNAAPFFRRLGGSEHLTRSYTPHGYQVIEIISKSPDRDKKTVRRFDFDSI